MSPGVFLVAGIAGLAGGMISAFKRPGVWLASTIAGVTSIGVMAGVILARGAGWEWHSAYRIGGEPIQFLVDGLSAFFLLLLSLIGGTATLYSRDYWPDKKHPKSAPRARIWWNGLLCSMALVLISGNGLHFLIGWELFTVCSYFLITTERDKVEVRKAGWLYLGASHAGTLCLFAFFASLAARTGSWTLGPMNTRSELAPLFWLMLFGFGVKAGLFPLHIWLPSAHANAPSHVSAILSGVAIKMGIYGIARFSGWLPIPAGGGWVVAGIGVTSAVLGVAFALAQHDLKRLLAYHSVENIGIILLGLGFALIAKNNGQPAWGQLALAGGFLHVWNHGLFKALLFLGAGSVLHSTGTREMSRLGGLWRKMPWTAGLFIFGAVAICGLPPLNGFISEWLIYLGLFNVMAEHTRIAWGAIPSAVLLMMTGALALGCFAKVCGIVFLGNPRSERVARAEESSLCMRVPMLLLGLGCVGIGLVPTFFWPALASASKAWDARFAFADGPPASLSAISGFHLVLALLFCSATMLLWRIVKQNGLRRGPTWDCGYAVQTPRMQYTAGSFASIITEWFSWILRPHENRKDPKDIFPESACYEEHTPETVLEEIVEPAAGRIMMLSTAIRRLQHGRIQAYLLYLLIGIIGLAVISFINAPR